MQSSSSVAVVSAKARAEVSIGGQAGAVVVMVSSMVSASKASHCKSLVILMKNRNGIRHKLFFIGGPIGLILANVSSQPLAPRGP